MVPNTMIDPTGTRLRMMAVKRQNGACRQQLLFFFKIHAALNIFVVEMVKMVEMMEMIEN